MSTDEFGERTQRPTERRRREARSRGEVARSTNLVAAIVLLASTAGLWWLGPLLVTEIVGFLRMSLSAGPVAVMNEEIVAASLMNVTQRMGTAMLPILMIGVAAAAAANLVQTGFLWVPTAVLPRFDRINPVRQMSRLWTFATWLGFGVSIIRLVVLILVLILFVRARLDSAAPLAEGTPKAMLDVGIRLAGELAFLLSVSLVVMAGIDYAWQYWKHEQCLKMTVEEVLREQRDENGDPRLKRQRRELAKSRGAVTETRELNGVGPV